MRENLAQAAELKVLSAGAIEPALVGLADTFRRDTGHQVEVSFATAPALRRKVTAGEAADILIAPPAVIEDFVKDGKVVAEGRAAIGRVGVGVAVRADVPVPDVSTPEALKKALLGADSLVYNEASTGIYFAQLLERLGIAGEVKGKTTRYPDGASVFQHLIKGRGNEIGVGAITEIIVYTQEGTQAGRPAPRRDSKLHHIHGGPHGGCQVAGSGEGVHPVPHFPASEGGVRYGRDRLASAPYRGGSAR